VSQRPLQDGSYALLLADWLGLSPRIDGLKTASVDEQLERRVRRVSRSVAVINEATDGCD